MRPGPWSLVVAGLLLVGCQEAGDAPEITPEPGDPVAGVVVSTDGADCAAATGPIHRGDRDYSLRLDHDRDGRACK